MHESTALEKIAPITKGVYNVAPNGASRHGRRTCAKLCRPAGGELEPIQMLLGHASVQTAEQYLGTKQDTVHAPNDTTRFKIDT